MFSTGQWIFAALFFVAFVIFITFAYRKDINLHRKYYKGTYWILLVFVSFIGVLVVLKYLVK